MSDGRGTGEITAQIWRGLISAGPLIPVPPLTEARKRSLPLFQRDAFPEPVFEKNAPSCIAEKEPCGFYSFGNTGNMPFKWVKSW